MINTNPTIIDAIISLVPNAEVVVIGDENNYTVTWNNPSTPAATNEQINQELVRLKQQVPLLECKEKALLLLQQTDWTVISDVGDSSSSGSYLINQSEFIEYRKILRNLVLNPVIHPNFPTLPTEQWSSN